MSKRKAPYQHQDGSNCWTKNCSLEHASTTVSPLQQVSDALTRLDGLFSTPVQSTGCNCGHTESQHGNIGTKQCLIWVNGASCSCKSFSGVSDGKYEREYRERQQRAQALLRAPRDLEAEALAKIVNPNDEENLSSHMNETEGDYAFWQAIHEAEAAGDLTLPLELSHPELTGIEKGLEDSFDEIVREESKILEDNPEILAYQEGHQPSEAGAFASQVDEMYPQYYEHPEWYSTGIEVADRETDAILFKIRNNPEAKITIYRAVPANVTNINKRDWVSLSKSYAEIHAESNGEEGWTVVSMEVSAKEIRTPGDSLSEFGWFPDHTDGPVGYE